MPRAGRKIQRRRLLRQLWVTRRQLEGVKALAAAVDTVDELAVPTVHLRTTLASANCTVGGATVGSTEPTARTSLASEGYDPEHPELTGNLPSRTVERLEELFGHFNAHLREARTPPRQHTSLEELYRQIDEFTSVPLPVSPLKPSPGRTLRPWKLIAFSPVTFPPAIAPEGPTPDPRSRSMRSG